MELCVRVMVEESRGGRQALGLHPPCHVLNVLNKKKAKTTERKKHVSVLLMLEVHGGFPVKCRSQHKAQERQQGGGRVMSFQFIQGSEGNGMDLKREKIMTKFIQATRTTSDLGLFHFHANLGFCLGLIVVPVASLVVVLSRPLQLHHNNETKI